MFGAQDMSAALRRCVMRRPGASLAKADPAQWHYDDGFDPLAAVRQHGMLAGLIERSGAEILWLEDRDDGLADAVFTQDASLVTAHGAILMRMGKRSRSDEPALHERAYRKAGIPVLGRIQSPGRIEGGDCLWLDAETLAVGRGFRTNEDGIAQLSVLLEPYGVDVLGYDLPRWRGEDACLHLSSLISPISADQALAFVPLLPASLYQMLLEWGLTLIEAPQDEFMRSNGLNVGVLPLKPRQVIMASGFEKTRAALENAGCAVAAMDADALGGLEGNLTGLVTPVLRSNE